MISYSDRLFPDSSKLLKYYPNELYEKEIVDSLFSLRFEFVSLKCSDVWCLVFYEI